MMFLNVALLGALVSPARAADAATDWMPLSAGNEWIFSDGTTATRVGVDDTWEDDYYYLTGMLGRDFWVWNDGVDADLWQYNSDAGTWDGLLETDSASTWSIKVGNQYCSTYAGSLSASGVSTAAAGTRFTDTKTWSIDLVPEANARCMPKTMQDITFARGVGPVAFESARGESWTLQGARIDGTWIAAAAASASDGGVEVSILVDATSHAHTDNGIRCITTPCPSMDAAEVLVTVVLANTGSSTETLDFSSGLQVDIDLYDSEASWVGSWSDGQMFTQATTQITLAAGERKLLTRTVRVADRDGALVHGDFAVAAWIPALDAYPYVWLETQN